MKKLLLTLSLALTAIPAMAGNWTVQSVGPFDFYHGSNGQSGTGQQVGDFYFYHGSNGQNYTGQRIGKFQYWNGNGN
jgi:hypothetical protein